MTENKHLKPMLANGLRYLKRGLDAFSNDDIDFALTDFYCGIEIILKAIVLHEDWRLIFDRPDSATLTNLDNGTVRTIGVGQAFTRLSDCVNKPISTEIKNTVNRIRLHRNKLMHFYHIGLNNAAEKKRIAADIALGWHALRLLRSDNRFQAVFSKHAWQHDEINAGLLVLKNYLKAAEKEIHNANLGVDLKDCDACEMKTVKASLCLLCDYEHISHIDIVQGADCIPKLNCPSCGIEGTVVQTNSASRCTNCGASHGSFIQCEYCNAFWLEDELSENYDCSTQLGCEYCGGNLGYLMSKDD